MGHAMAHPAAKMLNTTYKSTFHDGKRLALRPSASTPIDVLNTVLTITRQRPCSSKHKFSAFDKKIDVLNVPLSSIDNGPTLKVIRVTSCDFCGFFKRPLQLTSRDKEAFSLHYTYGVSSTGESDDTRIIMFRKGDGARRL